MSVTSWMIRNRTLRSSKSRRTRDNDPDYVKLDLTKDPKENILEILNGIRMSNGISEIKLLNYLNNYVKLISHLNFNYSQVGFESNELITCLKIACVHESTLIRTASLRALRYTIKTEEHVQILNDFQIPFLIARSFDLVCTSDVERVQALKLMRRVLLIAPKRFEVSLGRALVAVANGTHEEKDRMLRASLAALSELGVLNSKLFIKIGGVVAIIRNILECQTPHIAESLCGTLLHLMNWPNTRQLARIDLQCLAAPYCDFHYRRTSANTSEMAEEREIRFNCSRLALLCVLRSWPGILHFCNPLNPTCLKAMVAILYLEHLEVKNAVLDLLYELLNLPQPEWTDEFSVALNAVDPADAQESWRLRDGFVAAEGRFLLPHLARTTPNLAEIHLALLLYIFIEIGLLNALAEVIITGDTFICVRATILLGVLLHWTHQLLPPDCCNITPPLPNLVMEAANKHQALSAVAALQDLHTMLKQRPASSSLFLDHILMSSYNFKSNTLNRNFSFRSNRSSSSRTKLLQHLVNKDNENLLRDSAVLQNKDGYTWDWDIIRTILKNDVQLIQKIDESNYKAFIKRLIHYFKPSSNRFSHMDLSSSKQAQKYTLAGCDLIHFLLSMPEPEGIRLLTELFKDIYIQIEAITKSKTAHDCLFSPQHMSNTCCQMYFLFIGHLTHTNIGLDILTKTGIFEQLLNLATSTNHDCYVKLIISSMNYTADAYPRIILSKTLKCNLKTSRLYATQFLLVLLRAKVYDFERWGVELLVNQLYDQSKAISLTALNILHEACEEKVYLDKLISLKPNLHNLGDKGLLLLIRFLSRPSGFAFLQQINFIANEINKWMTSFNYRYVRIIEEELHDALTLHQRNEDGHYNRRISSVKTVFRKDIFIPPHLYGQLVQYTKGFNMLVELGNLNGLFKCIEKGVCETESDVLELKAALWACGNIAISSLGVDFLIVNNVFTSTINIAKTCPVYSVRGTAIYVLGIMSTTFKGANELFKLGWVCTRHDRHEQWPVIESENWELDNLSSHGIYWSFWRRFDKESESSDRVSENSSMQYWTEEQIKPIGESSLPEADGSVLDDEFFLTFDSDSTHNKSQTLPHVSADISNQQKHQRSLSESKTVDMFTNESKLEQISDMLNNKIHRHRDCSESSTSGVSSCDSVVGKYYISDRIQTLSPIPSSSSLSTLKSMLASQQRSRSDYNKQMVVHTSTDAVTISPTESTKLSHQDLLGYTTLRTLRHQNKPFYIDTSDDEMSTVISGGSDKIKFPINKSFKERPLEVQYTQLSLTDLEAGSLPNPILTGGSLSSQTSISKRTSLLRNLDKIDGPCYVGICMPRKLLDIFPNESFEFKYILTDDSPVANVSSSVENVANENVNNQISNVSVHQSKLCLHCCHIKSSSDTKLTLLQLFSLSEQKHSPNLSPSICQKLISNGTSDMLESRLKIEILRHVERLSNPVWYKQSRQTLLHLKQKHAYLFQDMCLYSEVCIILSSVTMRLMARRFLQEIFQDLNFEIFYEQSTHILLHKNLALQLKKNNSESKVTNETNLTSEVEQKPTDDFVKVRFFNSNSIQRHSELSDLMQSPEALNQIVFASTSSANVTKGFVVTSDEVEQMSTSSNKKLDTQITSSSVKNVPSVRSPTLASVKEEICSSIENLSISNSNIIEVNKETSFPEKYSVLSSPQQNKITRGQKTLVDSLCLTCSQNKFPITTRCQDSQVITRSYSFTKSKTIDDNQSQNTSANIYKNCISATTKCVPIVTKANKTTE